MCTVLSREMFVMDDLIIVSKNAADPREKQHLIWKLSVGDERERRDKFCVK